MNWNNLKNFKCPKCSNALEEIHNGVRFGYGCSVKTCSFFVGKEKFNEIVNSTYKTKKFQSDEDNLSELNNFGRKEMSKDFSDSKYLDY